MIADIAREQLKKVCASADGYSKLNKWAQILLDCLIDGCKLPTARTETSYSEFKSRTPFRGASTWDVVFNQCMELWRHGFIDKAFTCHFREDLVEARLDYALINAAYDLVGSIEQARAKNAHARVKEA